VTKGIDEDAIIAELPSTLQQQVKVFCAQNIIEHVPLFRGCDPGISSIIMSLLDPRVYVPGDLIVRSGDPADEMFIIDQGVCAVLGDDGCSTLCNLQPGAYFGELAVLFQGRRTRTVIAATHCYLYSLKHVALQQILKEHPACVDNIVEDIVSRYDYATLEPRLQSSE